MKTTPIQRAQHMLCVAYAKHLDSEIAKLRRKLETLFCPKCQDRPGFDYRGKACKHCAGTGIKIAASPFVALREYCQRVGLDVEQVIEATKKTAGNQTQV